MPPPLPDSPAGGDIRLRGFSDRVPVDRATAWIDAQIRPPSGEAVVLGAAEGRVLAAAVAIPADMPPSDRAAVDGYAVRAAETNGAGDYNPLRFVLQAAESPLGPGAAALVAAGSALPEGADSIVPFEAAQRVDRALEIFCTAAAGAGIERRGQQARAGSVLLGPGLRLRAQDCGLFAAIGIERLPVVRRPRVRVIVAGPKSAGGTPARDADGPMLRAVIARDGGVAECVGAGASSRADLVAAMTAPGADVILLVGRTGAGPDDEAPLALGEAGRVAIHGVALRPGGSTGMGLVGALPVILLPGDPFACLCAYEFFAGRLVRGQGGRDRGFPHAVAEFELGRKIVSEIGLVDICPVRLVDGRALPLGTPESGGLPLAVRAQGFVVVPAPLEGYAPGTRVALHLY